MSTTAPGKATTRYKLHWHVLFTHFPVSFFTVSFGFMVLHLFTQTTCFELAAYVSLIAGAAAMIPTTLTGWLTWKGKYRALKGKIFLYKIRISLAMIVVSFLLVVLRTLMKVDSLDILHNAWHAVYFLGLVLLVVGATAEGYYGGRLNHR